MPSGRSGTDSFGRHKELKYRYRRQRKTVLSRKRGKSGFSEVRGSEETCNAPPTQLTTEFAAIRSERITESQDEGKEPTRERRN